MMSKKMSLPLVARQGRQLQRYSKCGSRLIVGCIPYKLKTIGNQCRGNISQLVEVLVVTSQKREEIMFPKGGWELDETINQAACREALEEAGVQGLLEDSLGEWKYKSKSQDKIHEAVMFPLNVTEELFYWPEKAMRTRKWINVEEAMAECKQLWMREALDRLVKRLSANLEQMMMAAPQRRRPLTLDLSVYIDIDEDHQERANNSNMQRVC